MTEFVEKQSTLLQLCLTAVSLEQHSRPFRLSQHVCLVNPQVLRPCIRNPIEMCGMNGRRTFRSRRSLQVLVLRVCRLHKSRIVRGWCHRGQSPRATFLWPHPKLLTSLWYRKRRAHTDRNVQLSVCSIEKSLRRPRNDGSGHTRSRREVANSHKPQHRTQLPGSDSSTKSLQHRRRVRRS